MAFIPNDPVLPNVAGATFDPDQVIDNPYAPFAVGDLFSFIATEAGSDDIEERGDVFVTAETRMIEGVKATVVRDTVYDDEGRPLEDTLDWYAQDTDGAVWYLGEYSYELGYDEDSGVFLGTEFAGSWEWGVDGALPGHIRPAAPMVGDSYYQEFAPGEAEDAGQVLALDDTLTIGLGEFSDVIRTFDFSTSEPEAREFKYAAPGFGVILEQGLDEDDVVEDVSELVGVRRLEPTAGEGGEVLLSSVREGREIVPDEPEQEDFQETDEDDAGDASEDFTVTFLGGVDDLDNAVGVYEYDIATGEIGEGRIVFASSDRTKIGASKTIEVAAGHGLGTFVVSNAGGSGVDADQFRKGGLFFRNIATDAPATLGDGLAPVAADADGNLLPFVVMHALDGAEDGVNLLNHGADVQASELELFSDDDDDDDDDLGEDDDDEDDDDEDDDEDEEGEDEEIDDLADLDEDGVVLGFEERMSSDPERDGDYDDVVLAVSDDRLSDALVAELAAMFGSEVYARGGRRADDLAGGRYDDLLFGRGGDDRRKGRAGDDHLKGGGGDDVLRGGRGDDWIRGGSGDDVARFRGDADGYEIEVAGSRIIVTDIDASDGDFGTDTLRGVETLRFDDMLVV